MDNDMSEQEAEYLAQLVGALNEEELLRVRVRLRKMGFIQLVDIISDEIEAREFAEKQLAKQ